MPTASVAKTMTVFILLMRMDAIFYNLMKISRNVCGVRLEAVKNELIIDKYHVVHFIVKYLWRLSQFHKKKWLDYYIDSIRLIFICYDYCCVVVRSAKPLPNALLAVNEQKREIFPAIFMRRFNMDRHSVSYQIQTDLC